MMIPQEIEHQGREELIRIILTQAEQIASMEVIVAQLEADNDALRMKLEKQQKPPTNSKNASQPPSQDQKSGKMVNRPKRKHGPANGHEKHERKLVVQPEHVVELKAKSCSGCQADLSTAAAELIEVNQITELPVAKAEVIEVRQYGVTCQQCGHM